MDVLHKPLIFLHFLELRHGAVIEDLYAAMRSNNLSDVVMTALQILKKLGPLPSISREEKSEEKSNSYRKEGNSAYVTGKYEEALKLYNKALMFAPDCSMSMKLAYSNRSALLFKIPNFSACSKDIDMCLAMGCPSDITEKLMKRKADLNGYLWIEKMGEASMHSEFYDEYFKLNKKINLDVPCAKRDLQVIIEGKSSEERVVATKDINVGTVLAIETAFSYQVKKNKMYYSCYYCNKLSLNLVPCDGCCIVMFCNKDCKELSMSEGHDIECQFLEHIDGDINCELSRIRLGLKAALKIKNKCKSWDEFISVSNGFDCEGIKHDVSDEKEKFPILTNCSIVDLPYGIMFTLSFPCAVIINTLDHIQSFFPTPRFERQDAMRAFSRVMLYLAMYANRTIISSCGSQELQNKDAVALMEPDIGYFSLIGKLRHSCSANTLAVGLNNKIALVAVQTIKCGSELTISHFGQYDTSEVNIPKMMFLDNRTGCYCTIPKDNYELSQSQKESLFKLKLFKMDSFETTSVPFMFPKLCETLACLSNLPHSHEYKAIFDVFSKCIIAIQHRYLGNFFIN